LIRKSNNKRSEYFARYYYILQIIISSFLFLIPNQASSQNTWTRKSDFIGAYRSNPVSFSINGKGYMGTGGSFGYGQFEFDFWEYDPSNDTWSQKADVGSVGRVNAVGFSISGKGYIGLGQVNVFLQDFWEYNPQTNVWTRKNDFPGVGRTDAVSFVINSKGYIGTGNDGTSALNDFWEYNPSNDQWTQKTSLPSTARLGATGFSIRNKGYIGSGAELSSAALFDFWEYNPSNNQWTQKSNYPVIGFYLGSEFVIGYKAYVGISFGSDIYEYDPFIDTWARKADMSNLYRAYGIGFNIGNKGYMGLGSDNCCTNYSDFWEYTPGTTPSIETHEPVTVFDTKAILKGEIIFDGNYEVTHRGFVWSTSPNPTLSSYTNGGASTSSNDITFYETINSLKENTIYYFRAYATNSQGTSYGNEQILSTKYSIQTDGNQDGIDDEFQDNIKTLKVFDTDEYITIEDLNNNILYSVELVIPEDKDYIYPFGMIKFKVNALNTKVRIYYHGLKSLDKYIYRKLGNNNKYYQFSNTKYNYKLQLGNLTPTIELTLTDGGLGDYDGIVNGVIYDPGGPAIPVGGQIPTLSEWARIFAFCIFLGVSIWWWRRRIV